MTNDRDRTRQRLGLATGLLVAVSAIVSIGTVAGRALADETWLHETTTMVPGAAVTASVTANVTTPVADRSASSGPTSPNAETTASTHPCCWP